MKEQLRDLSRGVIVCIEINESLIADTPFGNKIPIKVVGAFTLEGKKILLRFKGQAVEDLTCSRCLKDTKYLYEFQYEEVVEREDIENFDFSEILRQELQLNQPLQVLCDQACKGLCPYCGKDRNTESCDCMDEQVDPRLSALKRLINE